MTEFTPARRALATYADRVGADESNLADLIADLLLLADAEPDPQWNGEFQLDRALLHFNEESTATPVPTVDELVADEPDRLDKLTAAITDLANLVRPDDATDPDFDTAPDTPFELWVTYSDGRQEKLDKVAEFHLVDRRTNTWPTGLALADDDAQEPTVGGWDAEGTFRKHDDRRLSRRPGW